MMFNQLERGASYKLRISSGCFQLFKVMVFTSVATISIGACIYLIMIVVRPEMPVIKLDIQT